MSQYELEPYMSKGEINRRYNDGTAVSALAELNGTTVKTMLKYIRGLEELAEEVNSFRHYDEEIEFWHSKGYQDGDIAVLADISTHSVRRGRLRMGLEANKMDWEVLCYDADGNFIAEYDNMVRAGEALGCTASAVYNALNRGTLALGKYKFKKKTNDILNLVDKTLDNLDEM